jgi:hypothetical protein
MVSYSWCLLFWAEGDGGLIKSVGNIPLVLSFIQIQYCWEVYPVVVADT